MKNKFKRALFTAAITSLPFGSALSAAQTWTGVTNNNMNIPTNWTTAVPINTDVANFTGTNPLNPTLSTAPAFNVLGISFSGAANYTVTANAGNTAGNGNMIIGASGVANSSGIPQTINAIQGGTVTINSGSTANNILYNIGGNTDTIVSSLTFAGASAAGTSTITVTGSNMAIPQVNFNGTSSLNSAVINASANSAVNINTTTPASTAQITLANAALNLSNPISVNKVSSDSTSPISLGDNLTINTPTGETLAGQITGTGSLIKNGPGSLIVSNTTNSYTGGSLVNAGTLIGSTSSLPQASAEPSATVAAGATLTFNDVAIGIFAGDIANAGTVTYIGTAGGLGSEIPGDITGTGQFVLNTTTPVTLFRLSGANSYTGGTQIINGILQVAPGSLPVATGDPGTASVVSNLGTFLRFTGTQTYSGAITGNGTVEVAANSDLTLTGINNTYASSLIDANATLHATTPNLPAGKPINLVTNTSLIDFTTTNIAGETFAGTIQGLGKVQLSGPGQLTLGGSGNTYAGGTFVNGGGTLIGDATSIPVAASQPSITISNSSTFRFNQTTPAGTYSGDILVTAATDTLESDGSSPLTVSGNIIGAGKLNVTASELILSGTGNTYSGGSFVTNMSTLTGDTTSLQGAISLNAGNLTFNQNIDGIFVGNVTGSSNSIINKNGIGKLILTTPSPTFQGETLINAGILNLNTILGGDVFINASGKLTGNGTIVGDLTIQGGTVSPGNSIGVLTVGGDYFQTSSSVYDVEITGAGQSDLIIVGGNANLAGTVHVISLDGVINPANNYAIMHVEGNVSGSFDQVVFDNPLIVGQVFYVLDISTGATNAILKVETVFTAIAMTSNELQVANQLNSITNPTPEEAAILGGIALVASTDPEAAAAILAQMSGQQYTNLIIAAELGNHQFLRRLYDPIRSIVTTYPCCQDPCCEPCPTLDLWVEGGGGRTFIQGTANTRGFQTDGWEVTGGVQSTFKRDWTIGLAGSYANDQVRYNVGGSGKNRAGYAGLYGLYRPANWYVLADAAFGYSEHDVRRSIGINTLAFTARAKPKIYQGSGYIEAGIDCPWNCLLLQPFLGFEAGYYDRQGFTETGASPLNLIVSKKSHTNVYSRLGAHITAHELPWNISLSVDLAWQYRITSLGNTINNRFESFGDNFTIKGLHFRNSSIDAAATISAVVADNWEVYLEAAGERWSRASTYNFLGGVKFSW